MLLQKVVLLLIAIIDLTFASGMLDCSQIVNSSGIEIKTNNDPDNDPHGYLLYQPLLHDCFRAHPYNTKQLPIQVGTQVVPMKIDYLVSIFNLLDLSSDGSFISMAEINFRWTDSFRKWNTTQIPLNNIHILANEIWHPIFILSNCQGDVCVIRPDFDSAVSISAKGKVSMTTTRKIIANCELNLRYFPLDQQVCDLSFKMYAVLVNFL